jgi:tRNA splicing endonuclease
MTAPAFPQQSKHLALPVELSPCEAKWCYEKGFCVLVVSKYSSLDLAVKTDAAELPQTFRDMVRLDDPSMYDVEEVDPPEVDERVFQVYADLKAKGFWICDGAHYGSDFSIYKDVPGSCHSLALIWITSETMDTRKLIQCIRVGDSNKKAAVFAVVSGSVVRYLTMNHWKDKSEDLP